jgi:hypothetical protein
VAKLIFLVTDVWRLSFGFSVLSLLSREWIIFIAFVKSEFSNGESQIISFFIVDDWSDTASALKREDLVVDFLCLSGQLRDEI